MGNIDTYVKKNGGKSFDEAPFNDVDNLVLSYLVYYDLRRIVPMPGQPGGILLGDAAARYREQIGEAQKNVQAVLLKDMGASLRYRDLILSDHVDLFFKNATQFAAMCVTLPDGRPYFVFRGVDDSVTGWQEAFKTSYMETPAQKMAAEYVKRLLPKRRKDGTGKVLIGGHSKGGNIGLYAAVHLAPEERDAIETIYQNDAPGLAPGSYDPAVLAEFSGRIVRITPQFSVIDSLYKNSPPDRIVRADGEGFAQHEPFLWVVEGMDFADTTVDPEAVKLQEAFRKWTTSLKPEESRQFVRHFFGVMQKRADEGRALDLSRSGDTLYLAVHTWMGASGPAKRAVLRLVKALAETGIQEKRKR